MKKRIVYFLSIMMLGTIMMGCAKEEGKIEKPKEVVIDNFYMVESNFQKRYGEEILGLKFEGKTEDQILRELGWPNYIISYSKREDNKEVLGGKVLIYMQKTSPKATLIDIKDYRVKGYYTDEINRIDQDKAQDIVNRLSEDKPIEKSKEIVRDNFYMIEYKLENRYSGEILGLKFDGKTEDQIKSELGEPTYMINYSEKENDKEVLNGGILMYCQTEEPTATYINIRDNMVKQYVTDEFNGFHIETFEGK